MKLTLINKFVLEVDVLSLVFKPEKEITWQAGQYLHYYLPHNSPDERGTERWFTIAAPPFEKNPIITTRYFGNESSSFKRALFSLTIGDVIQADNPEGNFVLDNAIKDFVFIAGGIGITPFWSIITQQNHEKKMPNIKLLYATNDESIVFKNELDKISAQNFNLKVDYFIGKHINKSNLVNLINKDNLFYISGPKKMTEIYTNMLSEIGLEKNRLKLDYFPGY